MCKYIYILALEMANRGNQHCVKCIGTLWFSVLFSSLAVLDPRVGHTIDVLSPHISVLCHYD